jgi:NAD(P)-dependent dehydrogenase (short-subunit alcohol dehydrogenase family)
MTYKNRVAGGPGLPSRIKAATTRGMAKLNTNKSDRKRTYADRVVWITGGGTGLGRALAKAYAAHGAKVAVSGRRQDRLDATVTDIVAAGGEGLAVLCDVKDEADIVRAVGDVVARFGRIDVAVANAGFGVVGNVLRLSADDWRRQFDVNLVGAVITARHALPELKKTRGRLALVGSAAAYIGSPENAPYCASKAALRSLGQALSAELAGTGVSCTTLHPGFAESEIGQVNKYGQFDPKIRDPRPKSLMWTAEAVAKVMLRAIERREHERVITGHGRIYAWTAQHVPGLLVWLFSRAQAREYLSHKPKAVSSGQTTDP